MLNLWGERKQSYTIFPLYNQENTTPRSLSRFFVRAKIPFPLEGVDFLLQAKKTKVVLLKHGKISWSEILLSANNTTPAVSRPPLLQEGEFRSSVF